MIVIIPDKRPSKEVNFNGFSSEKEAALAKRGMVLKKKSNNPDRLFFLVKKFFIFINILIM